MNTTGFSRIAITFAVMIMALWISMDVFASGSNAFGKFYFYMLIGAFILGLISPRRGFFFLLFCAGYLDYFKRLMILDSGLRQLDLYYVLGIAPAAMAGMSITVLYQLATATRRRPGEGLMAITAVAVIILVGIAALAGKGSAMRSLGDVVNTVIYLNLVYVVPSLFRTPEELRGALKGSILIFIPSILYYIYQSHAGFTWWEYKYLLSGLTQEIRQLSERIVRVFGTMNGAASATIVYSISAVILLFSDVWKYKDTSGQKNGSSSIFRTLLAMIFIYAAYRTFTRTGWILALFALFGFVTFRSKLLSKAFYISLFLFTLTVILSSGYIVKHQVLNSVSEIIIGNRGAEFAQASHLGTLNDRLEGFSALVNQPKVWTPFGATFAGTTAEKMLGGLKMHDAFTEALIKFGYIPLFFLMAGLFWLLKAMHQLAYRSPKGLEQSLVVTCLACFVGMLMGVLVSSAALVVYPVNFFLYFYLGIVMGVKLYRAELARNEPQDETVQNFIPPHLRHSGARRLQPEAARQGPGGNRLPAPHPRHFPSRGNV